MERPPKRRRLSSEGEDNEASTSSQRSVSPAFPSQDLRASHNDSSVSRIKSKLTSTTVTTTTSQPVNAPPDSILASTDTSTQTNFSDLGIHQWLTNSLSSVSIHRPTRIQASCIPAILRGQDCIGGSRTGSGKTLAFALPILQSWSLNPSGIFAIVLTPTRELALQIFEQFEAVGSRQGLKCVLVTGGDDRKKQALELSRRPHVVVATPGRLADHVDSSGEETVAGVRRCKFVVLDEADRLLSAEGKGSMTHDLETCLSILPSPDKRQTLLFTATVTPEVRALKKAPRSEDRLPVFISEVDTDSLAVPRTLKQTYQLVNVLHKEKYLHILLLTPANVDKSIIIFCNRTATANLLEYLLRLLEHRVTSLHSGLQHTQRISNLARFRAKAARILVATDVAARGLDIPDVGLVINYDLPRSPDDYIHRVGRTARAGRKGVSISMVGQRDVELVQATEERVGGKMVQYEEEGVSVEGRVVRDALNVVGEKKREAMLNIEEGRDVKGKRVRRLKSAKVT